MRILKVYTAKSCAPCKAMKPYLKDLDISVVEIDVDEHPELAAKVGVRSVPTLKLFDNNELVRSAVGGMSRAQLVDFVK